ncbi:MAG: tetratricopeptide repeat protein [Candidatus Saccharicenans sp.]
MERHFHFLTIFLLVVFIICPLALPQSQESTDILAKNSYGVIIITAWDNSQNVVGEGTGFIIGENIILVPYHIVSSASEAEITTNSGKKFRVEALVAADPKYDLAIVRAKGKFEFLTLESGATLEKGARLYALSEINNQVIITEGQLRDWLELSPGIRVMDIAMTLEKVACGSPLFNPQGKVVGLALVLEQGVKFGVSLEPILAMNRFAKGTELKAIKKENYFDTSEGAYLAGKAAYLLNEPGLATRYIEKYVKLKPDDFEAYLCLGRCYYQLRNFNDSYNNFVQALRLKPDDPQAFYGLGLNFLAQRKFKEAIEQMEKAVANKIDSKEIYFELGSAYEELQDFPKAAENYQKYVQSQPQNPWSGWLKLAQAYQNSKAIDQAILAYKEAIKLKPDDIKSYYSLGQLLAAAGQYAEAEAAFKKLIEINPKDAVTYYNQIIQMYDRAGDYEKAIEAVKKIIEINPKNEVAIYNLAIMYFKLNKLEEAVKALNDCLALKNDYTYAWYNLGLVYNKMNKHPEAVEAFKKYNSLAPDDPNGWLNIGLEYMLMKNFEKALPYLEKSVQLKPDNPVAQFNLAITYLNLHDNYSAQEVLKVLERLDKSLADRLRKLIK